MKFKELSFYVVFVLVLFSIFFFFDRRGFFYSSIGALSVAAFTFFVVGFLFSKRLPRFFSYLVSLLKKKRIRRIQQYLLQQGMSASVSLNSIILTQLSRPVTIQVDLSALCFFLEGASPEQAAIWKNDPTVKEMIPFQNGVLLVAKADISNENIFLLLQKAAGVR